MKGATVWAGVGGVVVGIGLTVVLVAAGVGLALAVQRTQGYGERGPVVVTATAAAAVAVSTGAPTATAAGALVQFPTFPTATASRPVGQVELVDVTLSSDVLAVTVSAQKISGDYLFENPVLIVGEHPPIPATAESLKTARLALLDMITSGTGQATLQFAGVPAEASGGTVVLNPNSEAASLVSPRIELPLAWAVATAAPGN